MTSEPIDLSLRLEISPEEFAERGRRVGTLAAERGFDAVLAWSRGGGTVDRAANVVWLTNHANPWPAVPDSSMWSGQAHAGCLVLPDGERVLISNLDPNEWRNSAVSCDDAVDEPFIEQGLAQAVAARGLRRARIGIAGEDALTLGLWRRMRDALPEVDFQPADSLLLEARRIKSKAEREVIRRAVAVGEVMMEAMVAAVAPGTREADVHAAGMKAGIDLGVAPYDAPMSSGPNAALFAPRSLPTRSDRVLQEGDLWHTDLYGTWHGYLFDFSRSTVAGTPNADQLKILEASVSIVEAVIEHIRPGVMFRDAWGAGEDVAARLLPDLAAGPIHQRPKYAYPHYGHTIGVGWEDLWIAPDSDAVFEEGMHATSETFASVSDAGFALFEQNFLVTADGVELTSRCEPRPWTVTR
ncbi:MAG: Xaa-Pro peptidase family protein [Actinomycetota bacterium]